MHSVMPDANSYQANKLTSWQVSAIKDIRMNPDTGTREQTQDGRHIAKGLLQKAVLGIRNQLLIPSRTSA